MVGREDLKEGEKTFPWAANANGQIQPQAMAGAMLQAAPSPEPLLGTWVAVLVPSVAFLPACRASFSLGSARLCVGFPCSCNGVNSPSLAPCVTRVSKQSCQCQSWMGLLAAGLTPLPVAGQVSPMAPGTSGFQDGPRLLDASSLVPLG